MMKETSKQFIHGQRDVFLAEKRIPCKLLNAILECG